MGKLKVGDKAPDFKGKDQAGNSISLADYKGKKLILYFYPKDNTTGCTAEACSLRDVYFDFIEKGYEVLGVSPDNEKSHQNFIEKYDLPFRLLADIDHKVAETYGVWGEKKMYGKTYMGIILRVIEKVNTKNHAEQILE